MKALKYIFIALIYCTLNISIQAQAIKTEDVIFKALSDEMTRNLTDLKLNNNKPPFFIADYFTDGQVYFANASLGAIIQSKENPMKNASSRLLVGDYKVTDENFQDGNRNYGNFGFGGPKLSVPNEYDYLALRRYYWSVFDKSYKSAIEKYSQKLTAIKQQNSDNNVKLDDYTQVKSVEFLEDVTVLKYDKSLWEKYIRELSIIFKKYPKIQSSSVNLLFVNTTCYIVNSEGSKIRSNISLAGIAVNASAQAEDGEVLNDHILKYAKLNSQLPTLDAMTKEVTKMAEDLNNRCTASVIKEAYQGTVVFEGDALAELFNNKLFGNNGLISSREPIYAVASAKGVSNKINNKIGKRLCNENISIITDSKTSTFENTSLVGAFNIDAEGVLPSNDLKLVDKGILNTLLSDRVPSPKVVESNGHLRFNFSGGYSKSPGVINIKYSNGNDYATLIKNVANETEKNGLEYFYIIRKLETSNFSKHFQLGSSGLPKPVMIVEVSTKTGVERMVRCANISDFPMLSFKYVLGGTTEQLPYNFLSNQQVPVSFIVPKAIAFNDISIEKDNSPKVKIPIVCSPLAAK